MNKPNSKTPMIIITLILLAYFAGFLAFRISVHGWHLGPEYYYISPTTGKPALQKVIKMGHHFSSRSKSKVLIYYLYWPLFQLDERINNVEWEIYDHNTDCEELE